MGIHNSETSSFTWALWSFWYSLTFTSSCACSRFHFCDILFICYSNIKALIDIPGAFWQRLSRFHFNIQGGWGGSNTTEQIHRVLFKQKYTHHVIGVENKLMSFPRSHPFLKILGVPKLLQGTTGFWICCPSETKTCSLFSNSSLPAPDSKKFTEN